MTHIESTLPEIVGGEVQRLLVSDADGLAAAALYDLVRKATGCRLPQPDGTPSSEVEELLALCSAVLRRHWQTPLTMLDGLSLQDLVSRLMADRMEGDATLGIPAVNGSVTEALSALLERKITGASEVADGVSLVQLLCGSAASASLTTLTDPTTGWTMDKAMPNTFANLERLELGCKEINPTSFTYSHNYLLPKTDVEYHFPHLTKITPKASGIGFIQSIINGNQSCDIYCPVLEEIGSGNRYGFVGDGMATADIAKKYAIYLPSLRICTGPIFNSYGGDQNTCVYKIVLGTIETNNFNPYEVYRTILYTPYLIHFEFGEGTAVSLNLRYWSPTMALRTDTTAEDYVDLREDTALSSNLLQFLSNFREFLFLRLADRTGQSALTLTLSQAVYLAITGTDTTTTALTLTLNQLGITDLTDKETQAGITLNTTYATWLETYRDAINWNIGYV